VGLHTMGDTRGGISGSKKHEQKGFATCWKGKSSFFGEAVVRGCALL